MGRLSREKGSRWERAVAEALSAAIYGRGGVLRRTPLSGGWGKAPEGDVVVDRRALLPGEREPRLYVECKCRAGIGAQDVFPVGRALPWLGVVWEQATQATPQGHRTLLVVRGNNWPTALAFSRDVDFLNDADPLLNLRCVWNTMCVSGWLFERTLRERTQAFRAWALHE